MTEIFQSIATWYMAHINYFTITLLMTIESSFIPFPSEIVVPPAAYLSAKGELNIFLVIFFSTFGALLGALFNYYFALYLGRKVIYAFANTKLAHFMFINEQSVEKSEEYFRKRGNISTLIGRLIPAIRQLISLPAGLARMALRNFIIYTTIGAGLWNIVLAILGYFFYSQKEKFQEYYAELCWLCIILGIVLVGYLWYQAFRAHKPKTTAPLTQDKIV